MTTNLTPKFALAVVLALLAPASIRAGTITVVNLPATGTDAATGITTNKHYVCAFDFGNNGSPPSNINGVPFAHPDLGNQTVNVTNIIDPNFGGQIIMSSGGPVNPGCKLARTSNTGQGSLSSQADGNMFGLLTDLIYVGSAAPIGSWLQQECDNLTIGHQYSLRIYYRYWGNAHGDRLQQVYFNGEGTWQAYSGNPLDEDAGGAHYLEYDFTASATNVFCLMTNLVGNGSAMIYGVTLEQTAASPTVPTIGTQPLGFTNWAGINCSLSVSASGSPSPAYQWYQNNSPVRSYTNASVLFSPLDPTNAGSYYVIVTNVAGVKTSNPVSVGVLVGTNIVSPTLSQVQLPATGTDAATGIGSGNNYLCVLSFGASSFAGPLNDVNFTPVNLAGNTQSGTDPNYGGAWTASTTDANGFKDVAGGGADVNAQADGIMAAVLAGASYLGVAPVGTTAAFNFGALTPGEQYSLRYYYRQWDAGDSPPRPVQFTFNGDGTNATFQTDEDNGGAYYLDYHFTAASSSVSLLSADESGGVNYGPMIYAITLQEAAPFSLAPLILRQPAGGTNAPGSSFDLSVAASGAPPLAYQWYKNGGAIAGATNTAFSYGYLRLSDAGSYQVVVTNSYGRATSSVAPLYVVGPVPVGPDPAPTDAGLLAAAAQADALAVASDAAQDTTNWSAHWIGPASSTPNLWLCYRKTFTLASQPASAVARIAADSKYWLWVNGQIAVREGELKRAPNPNDTWYDLIDLAPLLQAGSNTIAVLHCYFGKSGFSHLSSGTAGFLFEMNADGAWVRTDTTWRMVTNTAFQLASTVDQPNFRLSESSLRYDARLDLGAWTNSAFDDTAWAHPVDRGGVGGLPWGRLWQRPLPFWQELPLQDFVSTNAAGSSPTTWTCYLPVNEQFTPWLDISSSTAGLIIPIQSDAAFNGGAPSVNHEYVTCTGRQSFEFPGWINGHYVMFTVPSGVTVYELKYRPHLADTDLRGSFTCDDPYFTTLWNKAANTLGVNMMDTWGDPNRERANWIGDTAVILGQVPYAYDPLAELISRKCLLELVHWQRADNTMFAPAPANYKELPVQVLAAVGEYGVLRYYRNTGDLALLQQSYPAIKSYLLNVWQTNSLGLVIHRTGQWDWEDWGDNIDPPLLDNTWYLLALDAAAQIAPLVGQAGDAALFSSRAQGIRNQFNTAFWTGSAYRSLTYTGETDERGNAMAVLAGLTGPTQAAALRTVLTSEQHCSPYMEKYVLEALFALGYPDDALARMRSRYAAMVASSSTTLWETFPASGGFNHGWSGGPLTLLAEEVAGILPTSPGFATFDVRPALGTTLTRADLNVPSRHGLICISASRDAADYRLSVRVPPGSSGRAFQPASGGLLAGAALAIDGGSTAVMDDTAKPAEINVAGGNATLVSSAGGVGTLDKTGSGNLYVGATSLLSVGAFEVAAGQAVVSLGGQLRANALNQADGHITVWSGAALCNQAGTITCGSLDNLGTFQNAGGTLTIGGSATNQGTLRLLGNAQLTIGGAVINSGVLDIMTWNGTLPPGFVNKGMLLDRSAIKVEACVSAGRDFKVTIMGYAGHSYQLQFSDNLRPASWTSLGSAQAGAQAPLVLTHTNGLAASQRFYRVSVNP